MQRVISPRNENFNVLVQIKFLNIFLYISKKKTNKFTGPNKVLLVMDRSTGAHCEDWVMISYSEIGHLLIQLSPIIKPPHPFCNEKVAF